MKSAKKFKPKTPKGPATKRKKTAGFTADERAAMRARVREMNLERLGGGSPEGEAEVLRKIAELPPADRALAKRIHAIVKANAPTLTPKTWYGMPAYAAGDKVVCFFQDAHKFKSRYATLGFSDKAALDEGSMWPVGFALKALGPAEEARIIALLKKAVS